MFKFISRSLQKISKNPVVQRIATLGAGAVLLAATWISGARPGMAQPVDAVSTNAADLGGIITPSRTDRLVTGVNPPSMELSYPNDGNGNHFSATVRPVSATGLVRDRQSGRISPLESILRRDAEPTIYGNRPRTEIRATENVPTALELERRQQGAFEVSIPLMGQRQRRVATSVPEMLFDQAAVEAPAFRQFNRHWAEYVQMRQEMAIAPQPQANPQSVSTAAPSLSKGGVKQPVPALQPQSVQPVPQGGMQEPQAAGDLEPADLEIMDYWGQMGQMESQNGR